MPEKYVTVATYHYAHEAQLAVGRLEEEGIPAHLTGDGTVSVFSGIQGVAGQVQLQVEEDNQVRAQEILADCSTKEALDEDWQTQVEQDPSVWVCSLCGEPNADDVSVCPSCQTERQAVVSARPGRGLRKSPASSPSDKVERRENVLPGQPEEPAELSSQEELDLPSVETFLGDDLARRAVLSGLFGCLFFFGGLSLAFIWGSPLFFVPFTAYSIWLLSRLLLFTGDLSPIGIRRMCLAIVLNLVTCGFAFFYFSRVIRILTWLTRMF